MAWEPGNVADCILHKGKSRMSGLDRLLVLSLSIAWSTRNTCKACALRLLDAHARRRDLHTVCVLGCLQQGFQGLLLGSKFLTVAIARSTGERWPAPYFPRRCSVTLICDLVCQRTVQPLYWTD